MSNSKRLRNQLKEHLREESVSDDSSSDSGEHFDSVSTNPDQTNYELPFDSSNNIASHRGRDKSLSSPKGKTLPSPKGKTLPSPKGKTLPSPKGKTASTSKSKMPSSPRGKIRSSTRGKSRSSPRGKTSPSPGHSKPGKHRNATEEESAAENNVNIRGRKNVTEVANKSNYQNREHQQSKRKQKHPRRNRVLMEIKKYRNEVGNFIPRLPFSRVIKEVLHTYLGRDLLISRESLETLQECTELYLTQLFEDSYQCTLHRGCVTLCVKDIRLARFLRGPNDPGNT